MIVCVCKAVSARAIVAALGDGAHSVAQVGRRLKAGTDCGSCRDYIARLITTEGASCPEGGRCADCRQDETWVRRLLSFGR